MMNVHKECLYSSLRLSECKIKFAECGNRCIKLYQNWLVVLSWDSFGVMNQDRKRLPADGLEKLSKVYEPGELSWIL